MTVSRSVKITQNLTGTSTRNLQGWVALGRPALSSRWWSSCRQLGNVSKEMTQWHLPTLTLQTQESMVSSKILLLIVTVCQGKQPPACLFANSRTLQCNQLEKQRKSWRDDDWLGEGEGRVGAGSAIERLHTSATSSCDPKANNIRSFFVL